MLATLRLVKKLTPRLDHENGQPRLVYDNISADELLAAIREDATPVVEEKIKPGTVTADGHAKSARSHAFKLCGFCGNKVHRGVCKPMAAAKAKRHKKAS